MQMHAHTEKSILVYDKKQIIRTSSWADVLFKEKHSIRGTTMNHSQEVVLLNSFNNTRKISEY